MPEDMEDIGENLEAMALEVVTLEKNDIQTMGRILNAFCSLEKNKESIAVPAFPILASAVKEYLERLILGEADDLEPLVQGIGSLQSMYTGYCRHEECRDDVSHLLERLGLPGAGKGEVQSETTRGAQGNEAPAESQFPGSEQELTDEDRQILSEFVTESLESLANIEVKLIHLEKNPGDLEVVNEVFRPFHTLKGVSAFLNLNKINILSHHLENLLDKARKGEIKIEQTLTDITLETVDKLRELILAIEQSLENGGPLEGAVDIAPLIERIDKHNRTLQQTDRHRLLEKELNTIVSENDQAPLEEGTSTGPRQNNFSRKAIEQQVKVDTSKLDILVDMTGELIIAQSMLNGSERLHALADKKLQQTLNQINQITSTLQRTVMSMRMVPIGSTFRKMVRLVRDLAKNSGKEIELRIRGDETEIDRNMVDELYDPIVHIIRNAVDHGIEPPAEREQAGKDRRGFIELCAYHLGGNIVIEIRDDGRGLHKAKIREKAETLGLIDKDSDLTDGEICNLIFKPGFSTAEQVTDISGRGVGMDVVKTTIEKLRGRVEIASKPGQGSTLIIHLPLTLSVIEGMLARVGQERYIIPTFAMLESLLPKQEQYFTVKGKGEMILSRGELIPLVRLDRMFGIQADSITPWDGLVVVVEHNGEKRCLLIDELLGKEKVVMKSLGKWLKETRGVSGGTIVGDGRVALILDIPGILEMENGN